MRTARCAITLFAAVALAWTGCLDPEGTLKPIETVRGRGYRFAIPRNSES